MKKSTAVMFDRVKVITQMARLSMKTNDLVERGVYRQAVWKARNSKPVAILTARKIAEVLNSELSDLLAEKDPDEVTYQ